MRAENLDYVSALEFLANRCGISRQNVSTLIRRGTCEPRTAGKLASGLGVEVREIIEKEAT